jgi:hypothetical protein
MTLLGALLVVAAAVLAILGLADLVTLGGELLPISVLALAIGVLLLQGPAAWRR